MSVPLLKIWITAVRPWAFTGSALAVGYTTAGFSLKYAGLGDLAIFVAARRCGW